jgi:COMPASS component SWD3
MTVGDSSTEIFACRYDPSDKYVACGFGDGAIRVYNSENGKCSFTLSQGGGDQFGGSNDMPVCAVRWRPISSFSKTSNVLVSGHADGYLRHWHATSGRCLHQKKCEDNEENQLYTIDYNNDGTLLATGGKDKYVRLYDE